MSAWPRLFTTGSFAALLVAAPTLAAAQSSQDRADALNEEGKDIEFSANGAGADARAKHLAAADKFRQAIVLSPEARFYFNLCLSLYHAGHFGEALTACEAVEANGPTDKQRNATTQLIGEVKTQMREQGVDPDAEPVVGEDGGAVDDPTHETPASGQPNPRQFEGKPPPVMYAKKPATNDYVWSLGADLYGSSGNIGGDNYQSAGGGFRLRGDYMVVPAARVGLEGYVQYTTFGPKEDGFDTTLAVTDIGVGAFKHFCGGRVCVSPLIAAQLALLQPDGEVDDVQLATFGVRAEGNVAIAFGTRNEYVVSGMAGLNAYLPANGDLDPEPFGLDKSSAAAYFGVGFTYRMNTPFGQSPFFQMQ